MNVYIVEDDPEVRTSLSILVQRLGHSTQIFGTADAFLSVAGDLTPGCILLDLCLPGMDGLELQETLVKQGSAHRIVLLTGVGEVPDAVRAMKAGAIDFLSKPFRRAELTKALEDAASILSKQQEQMAISSGENLLDRLSAKERDVLAASSKGEGSKQVAYRLNLSVRTIEMHRSNIIRRLEVKNFAGALLLAAAEEARMAERADQ